MLTLVAVLLYAAPNLQAEAGRRTDALISEGFRSPGRAGVGAALSPPVSQR